LRKQAEQAAPQQERQSQIRYETALQTLGRSQCLSCERSLSRSDGQLPNFCMHWGLQIHCDCPRCNHHHLSFFPYCPACGLAASTVELTGWGGVTLANTWPLAALSEESSLAVAAQVHGDVREWHECPVPEAVTPSQ
jgi:hypothetical protein